MSSTGPVTKAPMIVGLSLEDCSLLIQSVVDYAIFMLHPDGRVATWNAGAEKIKGYLAHEIIGEHFSRFYPAADVGKCERELAIAREVGRVEDEGWRIRKDGSRFWADVVITALRDETGTLRGFAKVTRDLTERRNAEESLRQSEERFRLLVEGVTDCALYILDPEGRVTTWNLGAERMKGYKPNEIIGKNFALFFSKQDAESGKPVKELEIARTEGRFEACDWRIRKDGTPFWANVALTPLRAANGELLGYAKVTRDLTAIRQAEEIERTLVREQTARAVAEEGERRLRESEELAHEAARNAEAAARRAEHASRVKEEFLATVSHELRTPLNAIMGWTSLLRSRGADPSVAHAIEIIHRNAQTQARIVDDILDVARIVNGKLRLDLRSTDLVAIVNEAIEVVRPSADAKGISIEFVPSNGKHVLVGDPERLQQVVWNLLSNAVKFNSARGRVVVSIGQQGSHLELCVEDNGLGIEPDFLPYVFERFNQADGSTTRRFGGLGLGLAVVRHIVELHGGRVEAKSGGKRQGALFRVTLPIRALHPREVHEAPEAAGPESPPREHVTLSGVRVLVVDDDMDTRDLLEQVLTGAGAIVESAASAASGLNAVQQFRPHVLISDVGMPGEDGYTFVRRVRALEAGQGGGTPSIALTAYATAEDRSRALAAGFNSHVGKPVNPIDLLASVADLATMEPES